MPDVLLESRPVSLTSARPRIWEALVLRALKGMEQGYLHMTLPGGDVRTWGCPDAEIKASIRIVRPVFFKKCLLYGDVGFGESYVDGDWETDNLAHLISWMILNVEANPAMSGSRRQVFWMNLLQTANRLVHRLRPNSKHGSRRNIRDHYDLSNEFFGAFLDPTMTYSAAYFPTPDASLEFAQIQKYDRLCRKLNLQASDHVLEIGSGWGGFAVFAARTYGCRVTTVTVSQKQLTYARQNVRQQGLEGRVEVLFKDYREVTGQFDKIVSIEMLEAVGHDFLPVYFAQCHALLKPQGMLALQVITCPDNRYDALRKGVDWIQKHIFPGSLLPSVSALQRAINRSSDLILHNLEDMGVHYIKTLSLWRENFNREQEKIRALGFNGAFERKWNYYFSYCEAAFAMRNISVLQLVYTRPNNRALNGPPPL